MSMLLTADIHMDLNPENHYRWDLWHWLKDEIENREVGTLLILGDLTVAKDRHNSELVNRLVDAFEYLARDVNVYVLVGNHDYIDPAHPFFGFTEIIEGVKFIVTPYKTIIDKKQCYFLPATKDYKKWEELSFADCDYIFTHVTFAGVKTESGFPLPGVDPNIFGGTNARIWSGDIHTPQDIPGTNISYVGAPYRTNYGDTYTPRVVYIDNDGGEHDLHFPCPSKHLLTISNRRELDRAFAEIPRGDFIKIRVRLPRADYPDWPKFKQEIIYTSKKAGWNLHGNPELVEVIKPQSTKIQTDSGHRSPESLVKAYSKRHKFDEEAERFGLELLREVK